MVLTICCLLLALCACGGDANVTDGDDATTTTTPATTTTTTKADDGKVAYTVKVVDNEGNPVVGAYVQWCVEADYKVTIMVAPEGYVNDTTEYHYEPGKTEMTITLQKA